MTGDSLKKNSNENLVEEFINYLSIEKGLSLNTRRAYRQDMSRYLAYLRKQGRKVSKVSRDELAKFLVSLRKTLSVPSIARLIVTVRMFYRFLVAEEYCREDPTLNLESPKMAQYLPVVLTTSEVEALINSAASNTRNGLKNMAMIELTLDRANSFITSNSDERLLIGMLIDTAEQETDGLGYYAYKKDSIVYMTYLNPIFQKWVSGVSTNYGLLIANVSEYSNLDRFVFYSDTYADVNRRPRLKIIYTIRN